MHGLYGVLYLFLLPCLCCCLPPGMLDEMEDGDQREDDDLWSGVRGLGGVRRWIGDDGSGR